MSPDRVIEPVDVPSDGVFGLMAGLPCDWPNQLRLDGLEECVATEGLLSSARAFCQDLGIGMRLSRHGTAEARLSELAAMAHSIRRLMDNNPRDMSVEQIETICRSAF